MTAIKDKAQALVDAISRDNDLHGGLITRATLRASDELRVEILRAKSNEAR